MLEKQHTKFASVAQPDSAIEQLSLFGGIQQREEPNLVLSKSALQENLHHHCWYRCQSQCYGNRSFASLFT